MIRYFILLACALLLWSGCSKDDNASTPNEAPSLSINKIMPLGASRVEGARPVFESYRYELWKDLIDGGWTFDFIGTKNDPSDYPAYQGQNFDVDHEGRGGWTSGQILNEVNTWVQQTGAPDIVLFSTPGGNDALQGLPYQEAITNINGIIDILQAANPNITITIEQGAPARSDAMTPPLRMYFEQIQLDVLEIAGTQSTSTSRVIAVDMATGFTDNLFADEVHYNEAGADFVAERYYTVLQTLLQQ